MKTIARVVLLIPALPLWIVTFAVLAAAAGCRGLAGHPLRPAEPARCRGGAAIRG